MFGRDPAHSSYARDGGGIDRDSVKRLQPVWTISAGARLAAAVSIADGVLYYGAWDGNFFAASAVDGAVLWKNFVGIAAKPEDPGCFPVIGVSSQAAIAGDKVYIGGGDAAVYAFDRATGAQLWRLPLGDPNSGAYIWSSPTVYNNALYIGLASLGSCPNIRGRIVRIDLDNPDRPLVQYLMPEDDIGAGIWTTPAIDANTNTVFVTTGNGVADVDRGAFSSAIVALDATTLERKAHFFAPVDFDADLDWGGSPTLFTGADGTELVAAAGKFGYLYALNRSDLTVAWTLRLAVGCVAPELGCGSISTPAFDGHKLYTGAGVDDPESFDSGSVYAIEPSTGEVIWKRSVAGSVLAPVTVVDGLVFASTTSGLEVFDAETGEPLWNDRRRGTLYSQAVVVDGVVYTTYVSGAVVAWRPDKIDAE